MYTITCRDAHCRALHLSCLAPTDPTGPVVSDDEPPADGKIRFKKPKKRSSGETEEQEKKKRKTSSTKKVKNASLLSFTEQDEEDG